ncbi:ABC transporter substrate-binding protein [Rhizobium panacihumi]|uniref:ABC transporter substrate-binding protein n=1 Tax=Rhizobium panacihumi TaxID=2008450 RepID=UPI003D7A10B3
MTSTAFFGAPADHAKAETPKDTLVYATSLSLVISLDPHQNSDSTSTEIMANLYDRLLAATADGKLVPQLAESWQVTDKAIIFKLRKDISFASGRSITAKDVVWSMTRLMKLNYAVANKYTTAGYSADNIESMVHAEDDHTVRLDLTGEMAGDLLLFRLAEVSASIVDREIVEQHVDAGDWGNGWLRTRSAGSGPFKLDRWTPNEMVIMSSRPNYWGGAPPLKRVIMRHVAESQVQRLMLDRNDADIAAALSANDVNYFMSSPTAGIQQVPTGGFFVLAMNASRKPLDNPKVREAIFKAIDFAAIEKSIMGPYGPARHIPVPVSFQDAIPDPKEWAYDPAVAKQMLADAGYSPDKPLTIKTIAQPPRVDLATAVQASLSEVGIRAEVIQGSGADIVSMHRARDFDLLIPQTSAYMTNVLGAMEQFSSNPDNSAKANNAGNFVWRSAWDIPELTKLTATAMRETDPAARSKMYVEMQETFASLTPAVFPMFERRTPVAVSDRVQGYVGHPLNATRLENVSKKD